MPRCNCSGRPGSAAWLGWGGRYFGNLASALQLSFSLCWHSRYRGKGVGYIWDCCQSRRKFCHMREATDIFHTSQCFTMSCSVSSVGLVVIADSGNDTTQRILFLYISLAPGGVSQQCCNIPCHVVMPLSSIASSFHVFELLRLGDKAVMGFLTANFQKKPCCWRAVFCSMHFPGRKQKLCC